MEEIKLDVQVRSKVGTRKIRSIRRENFVPAVLYGGKNAPTPIKVERKSYERIMRQHRGQSVVFHLNVLEGEKKLKDYTALLKEEQFDPVQDTLIHIDFQRISLTDVIHVKVPILARGEAIGVKRDGGSLDQQMWELEVICLPTQIPERIEVDVKDLKIGDGIHVREIVLPEGVKTKHDPDSMVVLVVPPMKEKIVEPGTAPMEPEVLKEKPKEEKDAAKETPEAKAKEKAEPKPEKK